MAQTHGTQHICISGGALVAALVFAAVVCGAGQTAPSPGRRARPPGSVRLYVLDCGTLHIADIGRFGLKAEEVATSDLSVPCFLLTHPKGTLIWDTGAVPDTAWKATGAAVAHHLLLPDAQERDVDNAQTIEGATGGSGLFTGRHDVPRPLALPL
jgi:hypothetical protein